MAYGVLKPLLDGTLSFSVTFELVTELQQVRDKSYNVKITIVITRCPRIEDFIVSGSSHLSGAWWSSMEIVGRVIQPAAEKCTDLKHVLQDKLAVPL